MKYNSETCSHIIHFCNWVRNQFGHQVKIIRSDNGLEFAQQDLLNYYSAHGTERQTTCVHTPQENGVVERKHRHLLEVARAFRFQAGSPISFWEECVLTIAYLINRMPLVVEQLNPL